MLTLTIPSTCDLQSYTLLEDGWIPGLCRDPKGNKQICSLRDLCMFYPLWPMSEGELLSELRNKTRKSVLTVMD